MMDARVLRLLHTTGVGSGLWLLVLCYGVIGFFMEDKGYAYSIVV